ncbi:MAG: potassium channel family protein [Nanoarchaeota archaeon]|nr:potassium channel family protein [Nanoarchaeota archaeon]
MEAKIGIIGVLSAIMLLVITGSYAYHHLEGWSYVDSAYFSITTMTTIGYGDLHPTNDKSKMFTMGYALVGVGIMLYALSILASHYMKNHYVVLERRLFDTTSMVGRRVENLTLKGLKKIGRKEKKEEIFIPITRKHFMMKKKK